MIPKLNPLPLIPFVDGVPTEDTNQQRIKWIMNGETLDAAKTKTSNEGVLNQTGVQIQQNIVQLNDDGIIHNDKINEVIDVVNQVVQNLGAIGDTDIIETVNKSVADIVVLKQDVQENKDDIAEKTLAITGINGEIGVYDPVTDPKHRTIRKDIIFIKNEMGKYVGFDENGDIDSTSTGSGMKYKIMQNALGVSIHEGRITKLEDDWAQSDVGQLTEELTDIRNELGLKNMATHESVYVRLDYSQQVQDILSSSIDNINEYIGMVANPTVKIADTVDGLVVTTNQLSTSVNNPTTGLVVRVASIEQDIGTGTSAGTVKGEISDIKRHLIDIDDLLGEDSTEGLRGEVMVIRNDIGTDSTPNTIKGRVLNLENTSRDLSSVVNDLTSTVGNSSTGLVAANVTLGKAVYGDATSSDPFIKDGISKTAKDNKTAIGVNTLGSETGIYSLIAELTKRVTALELRSNVLGVDFVLGSSTIN